MAKAYLAEVAIQIYGKTKINLKQFYCCFCDIEEALMGK